MLNDKLKMMNERKVNDGIDSSSDYHIPVLFQESIDALNIKPDGVYVDCTFGGGGHSKGILQKLGTNGKLFAFDQDADAQKMYPMIKEFFCAS